MFDQIVIGLEVHVQLKTESKLFTGASNKVDENVNIHCDYVSAALPGTLPVPNKMAFEKAIRACQVFGCQINKRSNFDRKNYFYPDLPKGYQTTQLFTPIGVGGGLNININGVDKMIRLDRIHIEEDAGKLVHDSMDSYVNLNRAGVPLVEIVTCPGLSSSQEAVLLLKKIHQQLVYHEVTVGDMEKGNFRCDANISLKKSSEKELGVRAEIKNLNSFRFLEKAIDYEVNRQRAVLSSGDLVVQETRGFDSATGKTYSMRSKEEAEDYRYFPDPDLPSVVLEDRYVDIILDLKKEDLEVKGKRYLENYSLSPNDVDALFSDTQRINYFEEIVSKDVKGKVACNWLLNVILSFGEIDYFKREFSTENLVKVIGLVEQSLLNQAQARKVISFMIEDKVDDVGGAVKALGFVQVADVSQVAQWVDEVIAQNPSQIKEFTSGKVKLKGYLVGQVIKLSKGKVNPKLASEILLDKLKEN